MAIIKFFDFTSHEINSTKDKAINPDTGIAYKNVWELRQQGDNAPSEMVTLSSAVKHPNHTQSLKFDVNWQYPRYNSNGVTQVYRTEVATRFPGLTNAHWGGAQIVFNSLPSDTGLVFLQLFRGGQHLTARINNGTQLLFRLQERSTHPRLNWYFNDWFVGKLGVPITFVWKIKIENGEPEYLKIWVDNVLMVDYDGPIADETTPTDSSIQIKVGAYISGWNSNVLDGNGNPYYFMDDGTGKLVPRNPFPTTPNFTEHYYTSLRFADLSEDDATTYSQVHPDGDMALSGIDYGTNELPVVSITSPTDGNFFMDDSTIPVQIEASDNDGTIASVELYANDKLLTTLTNAPYNFDWQNVKTYLKDTAAISHFRFEKTVGDSIVDFSNTGANGILSNPGADMFLERRGFGWAIGLGFSPNNETRSHILLPTNTELQGVTTAFSICYWIKAEAGRALMILSNFTDGKGIRIATVSDGRSECTLNHAITGTTYRLRLSNSYLVDPNTEKHFAWVYDGATLKGFVNGTQAGSINASGIDVQSLLDWYINGNESGARGTGVYDDFRIYDHAIDTAKLNTIIAEDTNNVYNLKAKAIDNEGGDTTSSTVTVNVTERVPVEYYVHDSQGNDLNSGTEASPFTTVDKALEVAFPGDTILLNKGGKFPPVSILNKDGTNTKSFFFKSYGSGSKPVISAFVKPSLWVNEGANKWSYTDAEFTTVNMVRIGTGVQPKGRFPKTGYWTITGATNNTEITDSINLPTAADFIGGELVSKKNKWIIDTQKITGQTSSTITTEVGSTYSYTTGFGYFFQNHPNCLTEQGDWYYDSANKKVVIYSTADPATLDISISKYAHALDHYGSDHYEFDGIVFEGSTDIGAYVQYSNHVSFPNCEFRHHGRNGLQTYVSDNVSAPNTDFVDINNNAVTIRDNAQSFTIRDHRITRIGTIPGATGNGDGQGIGIMINNTEHNATIENGWMYHLGYIGIYYRGNNCKLIDNYGEKCCSIRGDGGVYYTFGNVANPYTNILVQGNIGIDCIGNIEGTTATQGDCAIFYADDNSQNITFEKNYAAGASYGMYFHNTKNINVLDNVSVNNRIQARFADDTLGYDIATMEVSNNTFVAETGQLVYEIRSIAGPPYSYGNIENNRLKSADTNAYRVHHVNNSDVTGDLSFWRTETGNDLLSVVTDFDITKIKTLYNASSFQEFDLNGIYQDLWGNEYTSTIDLEYNESIYLYRLQHFNQNPIADISLSTTSGNSPLLVEFSAAGSFDDIAIVSYLWDFGDGNTSTEINPTHVFSQGEYTVTLTVTDTDGAIGTDEQLITVTESVFITLRMRARII